MKEIPLTRGYVAIVDDEDYERVSKFKWHAIVLRNGTPGKRIYAARYTKRVADGERKGFGPELLAKVGAVIYQRKAVGARNGGEHGRSN